ncbi:hypothetical protein GCM10007338_11970 [Corynebacterium pelargi]|nr:hypothetical protein GCM10007338_11970 [Corynebacterium pelargi]
MMRASKDRHGRGVRGPLLPTAVPRFRTRRELFDAAVLRAYAPIHDRWREQLSHLDIAVDTIPRMRINTEASLIPEEITADGIVPLGRVIPAGIDQQGRPTRARIVLFRMPIEQRSSGAVERDALLRSVLTSLVATYLNLSPKDIDPHFSEDEGWT